jgi:hypothetical protein
VATNFIDVCPLDRIAAGLFQSTVETNQAEHAILLAGFQASYVRTGIRLVEDEEFLDAVRQIRSRQPHSGQGLSGREAARSALRRTLAHLRRDLDRRKRLRPDEEYLAAAG